LSEIPGERSETRDLTTKDVDGRVKPGHDEKKMQKTCDGAASGHVEHKKVWGFVGLPLESP